MSFDYRLIFVESWLEEAPQRVSSRNDIDALRFSINEFQQYYSEKLIGNNIFSLEGVNGVFVYAKDNNIIVAAIELQKTPQNLEVVSTAKDPEYFKKPPYITDLYKSALSIANNNSLKMTSDKVMTDDGLEIWRKLLDQGLTVSIYNTDNPGTSHKKINNYNELSKYFGNDVEYQKYRFTLSESTEHWFKSVREIFLTRRLLELANITLDKKLTFNIKE